MVVCGQRPRFRRRRMGEGGGDHGSENHVKPGSFEKSRGDMTKNHGSFGGGAGGLSRPRPSSQPVTGQRFRRSAGFDGPNGGLGCGCHWHARQPGGWRCIASPPLLSRLPSPAVRLCGRRPGARRHRARVRSHPGPGLRVHRAALTGRLAGLATGAGGVPAVVRFPRGGGLPSRPPG